MVILMGYKIKVDNKYADSTTLKLEFDTRSMLLHEATFDMKMEVHTARMNQGRNPFEQPLKSSVTYTPTPDDPFTP